ncbi:hypothetical protein O7635_29570 [Asanoa sp. WMMD1127]|uniref:hypothetical protein n=1 Tax=Asanoa sp. WMMD1127 TaxID=3016107 RepID=UPI002415CA55|nr:hypothetical protein [Asanoa sp. WMMD1127]MDG4826019.1 hypothetical protein [Asanoa sp. WMMD1127]
MTALDLNLNPDELTLGDLEDFEAHTGTTIDKAFKTVPVFDDETGERLFDEKGRPITTTEVSAKTLVCLVWIVVRKSNPDFTVADARNVRVTSLTLSEAPQDGQEKG